MSQPPYGSPPPPPGPYEPYGAGGGYGYPPQPPRNDHTARNVIIGIVVVVVLLCGGLVWAIFRVVDAVGDGISEAADAFESDYPGSEDDPLEVQEGEAFSIRGFDYDAGWDVLPGAQGVVQGVRGTNNRSDEDGESVRLVFTLYLDNEKVGELRCDDPGQVSFERSATLSCASIGQVPARFDTIEVYDSSLFK
ncbi:hypothetical protein GCM10023340_02500 [Nocardioides marinquilinus]|uniref:Uncharacterized protein n=1 Tax=Nocardioides marinquilinus TaxID=1210400 RepID=A0ABP9P5L0_9ACTN